MNIAIIGANGKAGKMLVDEAIKWKLNVTAISRHKNTTNTKQWINKDIFDLSKKDLKKFDVVISALGFWSPDTYQWHSKAMNHLIELLADTKVRLIVIGGAGSLFLDQSKKTKLLDSPDFPEMYVPVAKAMNDAFDLLKHRKDIWWTYVSPALNFEYDAPWTGNYKVGGDVLMWNSHKQSAISYLDFSQAVINEIVNGKHLQQQISVVGE